VKKNLLKELIYEAFSSDWKLIDNDALSENGLMADKTMKTVLHLIEAYTVLYEVSENGRVLERLKFLLSITKEKIFDSENNKLLVFFDKNLNVIGDIHSYGHDIEASWLLDRACEVIGDKKLQEEWKSINLRIAENIHTLAFKNGALNNERDKDKIDNKRVWWVQAESVVGYINAYQNSGDKKYLDTVSLYGNG
jgi:mannobiose 2-epimerase